MRELVSKAGQTPLLPFWTPQTGDMAYKDHIKTLAIPEVQGLPSLLLHDLCSKTVVDEKQTERIADIFEVGRHRRVDNYNHSRLADINAIEFSSTLLALVRLA